MRQAMVMRLGDAIWKTWLMVALSEALLPIA
jgi:hypothetical protein